MKPEICFELYSLRYRPKQTTSHYMIVGSNKDYVVVEKTERRIGLISKWIRRQFAFPVFEVEDLLAVFEDYKIEKIEENLFFCITPDTYGSGDTIEEAVFSAWLWYYNKEKKCVGDNGNYGVQYKYARRKLTESIRRAYGPLCRNRS